MEDIVIEQLNRVFEEPINVTELVKAFAKFDSDQLPGLLKKTFNHLNKQLNDWQICATEVSALSGKLNQAKQQSEKASTMALQSQYQLSQPVGIENLTNLLSQAQNLLSHEESLESNPVDTWQQKKDCLEKTKQLLLNHLKVIAQNDLVERYHQLPKYVAQLNSFDINASQNDTVESIDNLLNLYQTKLKDCQQNLESLSQLTVLLPMHNHHLTLYNKIKELNSKIEEVAVERNQILGKIKVLQPFVDKHPIALKQEIDNNDTFNGVNQNFCGLFNATLVRFNLVDKSVLSYQAVQRQIKEYLLLSNRHEQLIAEYNKYRTVLIQYKSQLEELKEVFRKKGIEDCSSYGLTEKMKEKLRTIDPEFNYNHIKILLIKQRVEFLKHSLPKDIERIKLIVPQLKALKEELSRIRLIRQHYGITATNEELSQDYPWQSSCSLSLQETTSLLKKISDASKKLAALCVYEQDLRTARQTLKNSDQSRLALQQDLTEKQKNLRQLENDINMALSASKIAMKQVQKNLEPNKPTTDQQENNCYGPTSSNLWKQFLQPLIGNQPDNLKQWLRECCNPDNKTPMSEQQKLQFEQLRRDLYTELKYAQKNDKSALLTYQAMFKEPEGFQSLLNLKPAISIDSEKQLPPLSNRTLAQALDQFKQTGQQEKGKTADIILQTANKLHYVAWLSEQKMVDIGLIETIQQQFTNDPSYQCLQQSKAYDSFLDWVYGICQLLKQIINPPASPLYHYGLFSKKPAFLEEATSLCQTIAACA